LCLVRWVDDVNVAICNVSDDYSVDHEFMIKHKVFENVKITFKGSKIPLELDRAFYDFFITDGVITVVCFDAPEKNEIVAAKIYNPNEIKLIEVW